MILRCAGDLSHQCHELAPTGDFEFSEDGVKMLFHHRQTQSCLIGDLLVAPPITNQSCNFLLTSGQAGKSRQPGDGCLGMLSTVMAQGLALDQKMWPRQVG